MATAAQRRLAEQIVRQLAGANDARPYYGAGGASAHAQSATAGGLPRRMPQFPGTFTVRRGVNPSDADVTRFMQAAGMRTPARSAQRGSRLSADKAARTAAAIAKNAQQTAPPSIVEQMLRNIQEQQVRAREENLKRYDQIIAGRLGSHGRAMAEADNWGKAQSMLNEERAQEALDSQMAALAHAGIANSNVLPAFQQRNARDLALQQQALSEAVSNRKIGYDTSLSDELYDAVERRNDIGPDPNQTLSLAMQYEQAQAQNAAADGLRKQVEAIKSQLRSGQRRPTGVRPAIGGGVTPVFLNPAAMGYGNIGLPTFTRATPTVTPRVSAPRQTGETMEDVYRANRIADRRAAGYRTGDAQRAQAAYIKSQADERQAQRNMQRFLEMNRRSNRGWM